MEARRDFVSAEFARLLFNARSDADLEKASTYGRRALASRCLDTSRDYGGFSAFGAWSCRHGISAKNLTELFEILMASGASTRINDSHLNVAIVNRNWVAFNLLMNRPELDLNARCMDDNCRTPLMMAVWRRLVPYVQVICQRYWSIDFLLRDQNGDTALKMSITIANQRKLKLPFSLEIYQIQLAIQQAMKLSTEYQKSVAAELSIRFPRVLSTLVFGYFVMRSDKETNN